ncbi:MAG: 2-phosphosulfolactate phosphatase [Verrucomicrobiae bacterium]|nr:2-phosphosulfolactate phosphatase [Verrucomicrobiae bacterium]
MTIETILSPTELPALAGRDLRGTACVVFDILRATSTFVTALHHGAEEIIPVSEIAEAMALRHGRPDVLLAGERDGVRIRAALSGGIDFDFGNSPREFTPEAVRGKTIVSTTTNGTRALRACAGAKCVLAAAFLNLGATVQFLAREKHADVLLVCAGTGDNPAAEDIIAAGAMAELLAAYENKRPDTSSNTFAAKTAFFVARDRLPGALRDSQNGRRLYANPELREDVAFCAQRDVFRLVAVMGGDGSLRRAGHPSP